MNRVSRFSYAAIILILFTLIYSIPIHAAKYKCIRVTDGDTITVTQNGFKTTIRLVGIDAPETSKKKHQPGQPFSQASTKYLAALVLNKNVDIVSYGNDRYGRTLGVVYTGSTIVGMVHGSADKPGEIKSNKRLMTQAEELGKKLVAG